MCLNKRRINLIEVASNKVIMDSCLALGIQPEPLTAHRPGQTNAAFLVCLKFQREQLAGNCPVQTLSAAFRFLATFLSFTEDFPLF